ncbi:ATP-grasp domain-containing protein [Candidatus Fermentibacteria bacterium]|nr:ATP-grasp domain-containing protein [Candidatus Fermentibacteria bacterium]
MVRFNHSRGVLVLGIESQGLAILRSLGRAGISTVLLDQDSWGVARFSRYGSPFFRTPRYSDHRAFADFLLEVADRLGLEHGGWTLFPTDDDQVEAISRFGEKLSEVFKIRVPCWEVVSRVLRKNLFYTTADELGIPHPRSWFPIGELNPSDLEYPVIIKPVTKTRFGPEFRVKAIKISGPEDLERTIDHLASRVPIDDMLVQEFVPGRGDCQMSFASIRTLDGRTAGFTAVRKRQHPPEFGKASTYVKAEAIPEIIEYSQRLLSHLDYHGVSEIEFKRDSGTGVVKMLEMNARFWGWHSIGSRCGLDLPRLLFDDIFGSSDVMPGMRDCSAQWVKIPTDLPIALGEIVAGRTSFIDTLRLYLGIGNVENATFSPEDPFPFFAEIALIPYLMARRGY